MKTLTVHQPWAWGIIHGKKRIENRSRPTRYRGRLAIHAGLSRATLREPCRWQGLFPELPPAEALDFGAIVGTVELYDCVPLAEVSSDPYALGPWCWLLRDPQPLPAPVPCLGQLGLFECPLL